MKSIYLKNRLFIILGCIIVVFLISFAYPAVYKIALWSLYLLLGLVCVDLIILFILRNRVIAARFINQRLSLGDTQEIVYTIENNSALNLNVELADELASQLQHRATIGSFIVGDKKTVQSPFSITPVTRGVYSFGDLHLYISTPFLSLVEIKRTVVQSVDVKVIPSIIQMKKYELQVFSKTARNSGIRRIRQVGENDEFEHIRAYAQGDNIKAINWKASSRLNILMINQFQNTKSQNVYCIVDKGRSMKMPFNDLTLLDYAINSTLVISNIVLKKYDRVGLITYSNKIGSIVKAESVRNQLEKISNRLYYQKTEFKESSLELLHVTIRKKISRRSILVFFTNFENQNDLKRNLPYLKSINKKHLLLVIFFINTELIETSQMTCRTRDEIYLKTFAQRALIEKEKIKMELNSNGIQAILTKPEDLSINVINKYLEIKAKRML